MAGKTYGLTVTFTEPLLGGLAQKDVTTAYIQKEAREKGLAVEDELETLPEMIEKSTTVFHRLDGEPILYDYHVKGFLKEAASVFNGQDNVDKVKALRSKVDNLVFVSPRRIWLERPQGSPSLQMNERPLRAMTAQGPRIALARSEEAPVGTQFKCQVLVLPGAISEKILRQLLDYGQYKGMGQWRNGGFGRFKYELKEVEGSNNNA